MTDATTAAQRRAQSAASVSRLHADAWAAWNASYHTSMPDTYRAMSRALYQQALQERIQALFARLDEQNGQLDALMCSGAGTGSVVTQRPPWHTEFSQSGQADGRTRIDSVHGRAA